MRRIAHRVLSAAPLAALAFAGVWATAEPANAAKLFNSATLMLSDVRFFWFCLAVIAAYSCLWWATSLEPRSRRSKIQAGLRPLYERLTGFQHTFETAATYDDVEGQMVDFNRTLNEAGQWIAANMSSAAFQKFKNPKCDSMVWSWPGDGKSAHRSNIVVLNRARLDVLDTFLRYDGWDGEQPTLWARAKKGLGFEK